MQKRTQPYTLHDSRCTTYAHRETSSLSVRVMLILACLTAFSGGVPTATPAPSGLLPSFPGAEGYGALSKGGRGGRIIEVTNLNDSGPGSFRDAITQSGPRIVVFRVGGIIQLSSSLEISNPYITIAGQTAPGGGITISGKNIARTVLSVYTHDVVIQYLRLRKGHISGGNDAASVARSDLADNVIWDHNSLSWTQDESFAVGGGSDPNRQPHNVTHSWNLVSEPLYPHATSLLTNNGSGLAGLMTDIDAHHNLLANTSHRNPLVKNKNFKFVNNIVYNWSFYASQTGMGAAVDFIGNLYKEGSLNDINGTGYEIQVYTEAACSPDDQVPGTPSIYVNGNIGPHNTNLNNDNWGMVRQVTCENGSEMGTLSTQYRRTSPLPVVSTPTISVHPANQLESTILPLVGASRKLDCSGNWVSNRDTVDERIIREYQTNKGVLVSNEADVGGWPIIANGTPCADTDHDGMFDMWESQYGFNPNDSADSSQDADEDGYINVEEFLNGTNPTSGNSQSSDTTPPPAPTGFRVF